MLQNLTNTTCIWIGVEGFRTQHYIYKMYGNIHGTKSCQLDLAIVLNFPILEDVYTCSISVTKAVVQKTSTGSNCL